MGLKFTKKKLPKRTRGQRAGLSREQIIEAGLTLLETNGIEGFTARRIAAKLGVHPQAVLARFESVYDLRTAIAAKTLEDVAPPFAPGETSADYIRRLFRDILLAFHKRGSVASLAYLTLVSDRMAAPLLLERLAAALCAAGIEKPALRGALDLVYAHLIGMLAVEAGSKSISLGSIQALGMGEYATLHALAQEFASAEPMMDVANVADRYCHATILALGLANETLTIS